MKSQKDFGDPDRSFSHDNHRSEYLFLDLQNISHNPVIYRDVVNHSSNIVIISIISCSLGTLPSIYGMVTLSILFTPSSVIP